MTNSNSIKWVDREMVEKLFDERVSIYGVGRRCLLPEKSFSAMTNKELRTYATIFSEISYINYSKRYDFTGLLTKEEESVIIDNLNREFNKRVGIVFSKYYNFLNSKYNRTKQLCDERYKLLSFSNRKGCTEMSICKAVKEIINIPTDNKDEHILKVMQLTLKLPCWDFGFERNKDKYTIHKSEHHAELNRMRLDEIKAQNRFINSILV